MGSLSRYYLRPSPAQEVNLIPSLFSLQSSVEAPQGSNPAADSRAGLEREGDSGVLVAFRGKAEEILVVGAQDSTHLGGAP